ncbi:MAG: type II toxin-antitoxin system HicB family antitoxin [Candidatus Tectomicrobia bacterium]|nr:type II toxin-antitoxin system HicB family antitoxin [Candidatus Tectomicrobia bacterium]
MKYAVVVEKAENNYSAYAPDLPGCIATGKTKAEATRNLREAIALHVEVLREDGLPVPEPQSSANSWRGR